MHTKLKPEKKNSAQWTNTAYMALGLNVIGAIPGGPPRHFWEPE